MRRIAAMALLALAGCGSSAPSSVVPADASMYFGVDASEAERVIAGTSRADVEFERDVQPWLGDRAAYFADSSADAGGIVLEVDDEDAAEAFGRKVTAAGPQRAFDVIDGKLVLAATPELLRAARAAEGGQSLADSTELDVAGENEEGAPDILLAIRDPARFDIALELFKVDAPDLPELGPGPVTARVWRRQGEERIEIAGLPDEGAAPSLADLSGAAWLAVASADLSAGDPLAVGRRELEDIGRWPEELDLDALLRHAGAGTMAVEGEGRNGIGARIVADVKNEAELRREIAALARELPRRRYIVDLYELDDGTLHLLASPKRRARPHFVVDAGERLAIETGQTPGGVAEDLGDTPRYRDAERRLRGAPTLLVERESGYRAARRDGEALRLVHVYR